MNDILNKKIAAPLKVNINKVYMYKKVTFITSILESIKEANSEKVINNNRAKIQVNMYFFLGKSALLKR